MSTLYWAIVSMVCILWTADRTVAGYQITGGEWRECPEGYVKSNGLCYKSNVCQEGYFLHTDGLCYLIHPKPCPNEVTTEAAETTTEEITTTTTEEITTTTEEITTTTTEEPTTTEEITTTTTTTEEPTTTTTEEPTTTTTEEPTTTTTEEPTTTTTEEPTTTTTEEPTTTTTEEPTTTTEEPTTTTTEEPTTTTTEEPRTTTTEEPIILPPDETVRCPPGSIFFNEQCRKIVCTEGEYYKGRCLSPACPVGTVWRGKRCQPPGYITTILEIENVVDNQFVYQTATENVNHVEYDTLKPYDNKLDESFDTTTRPPQNLISTFRPNTDVTEAYPGHLPPSGCCVVKSPRLCRPYPPSWVCFNRSQKLCDERICTRPIIYLKPPKVVELSNPRILVMPPNPPLNACATSECPESERLNCSGCAQGDRETCSPGCYNYFCPGDSCEYKNSEEFCQLYPGGFGCNKDDGCVEKWCYEKCH